MLARIKGTVWKVAVVYAEISGKFSINFRFLNAIVLGQAFIKLE